MTPYSILVREGVIYGVKIPVYAESHWNMMVDPPVNDTEEYNAFLLEQSKQSAIEFEDQETCEELIRKADRQMDIDFPLKDGFYPSVVWNAVEVRQYRFGPRHGGKRLDKKEYRTILRLK